mgnify:CR=1 FL=1
MDEGGRTVNIFDKQVKDFIESIRPGPELRDKLDIGYTYENQTLQIYQIHPPRDKEDEALNIPIVRVRYVKSRNVWIIYCLDQDGNWTKYEPKPEVNSIRDVFEELMEDRHHCFWE